MKFWIRKNIAVAIMLLFNCAHLHADEHLTRSFGDCQYVTDGTNGTLTLRYTVAFPVTLVIHFEGKPESNAFTLSAGERSLMLDKLTSICVDQDCVSIKPDYQKFFKKVSPGQQVYLTWPIRQTDLLRVAGAGADVMQLSDGSNVSNRFATWVKLPKEVAKAKSKYTFEGYIPEQKTASVSEKDIDAPPLMNPGTCRWEKGSLLAELICQWDITHDGTLKLTWVNGDKTIGFFLRCGTLKMSLLPNNICIGDACDLVSLPPFTHEIKLEKGKTLRAKWTLMADGLTELAKGQTSGGSTVFELTETVSPYKLAAAMTLNSQQTADPWAAQKRAREQALAALPSTSAEPSFKREKLPNSSVTFKDWIGNDGFGLTITNKTDKWIMVYYRYQNNGLQNGSVVIKPNGYFNGIVSRFSIPKKRYEYRDRKQMPGAPIALGVAGTQDKYEVTYRTGGGSSGELEEVWTVKPNPYSTAGPQ